MAKIERTYNVPLRKEARKCPRYKRTNKAVKAVKIFLKRHMRSENIKLGKELNEMLWKHGIKNPPHHIKITVTKDDDGLVKAELFGFEYNELTKDDLKELEKKEKKSSKKAAAKDKGAEKEIADLEEELSKVAEPKKPAAEKPAKKEAEKKPETKPKKAPAKKPAAKKPAKKKSSKEEKPE